MGWISLCASEAELSFGWVLAGARLDVSKRCPRSTNSFPRALVVLVGGSELCVGGIER
jgi:hypothetical protein